MVYYELKKIFCKGTNKAAILLLCATVFIFAVMAVYSAYYVDEAGNEHKGPGACHALAALQEQWEGPLTEAKIREVLQENVRINAMPQALSEDVTQQNIAYSLKQGFSDIRNLINYSYDSFNSYDYYKIDSVGPEEAGKFYANRLRNLKQYLEGDGSYYFTDKEKAFLISQYEQMEAPLIYEPHIGWAKMIEYFPGICSLLALVVAFVCAGIFSGEFSTKADAVFFSALYGRNRAVSAKIKAGCLIITLLYWVCIAAYVLLVLLLAGWGGSGTMIQTDTSGWKSFYNITFLEQALWCFVGGYVGCLVIGALTMVISAKTKSTILAAVIPFILIFFPEIFSSLTVYPFFETLFTAAPGKLLQINELIEGFSMYTVGGKVFGAVYILIPLYAVIFCVLVPILYRVYKRQR